MSRDSSRYDFSKIEKKWRSVWQKEGVYEPSFKTPKPGAKARQPFYNLMMFPYPSAEGLHVGNMYAFTGSDVYGRFMRMQGRDVFQPIGLDGFGIHSENYAMKVGTHPAKQAKVSEKRFYKQLESIGNGFAWKERLETYAPEYYKWTQWIFAELFRAGLAYRKKQAVNWCPKDQTVLADEQVEGGKCERCGEVVEKRELEQWFFRITKYAERLLQNTEKLDWTEKVRIAQRNWIGKSEGAEISFPMTFASYSGDVVFATNNLGKLKRMQHLIDAAGLKLKLRLPKEVGVEDFYVEEDGMTLAENSEKKARALFGKTALPILGEDSGLYIHGEEIDAVRVKRNALGDLNEKDLSKVEIGKKMAEYYQAIAAKYGGSVDAEWRNDVCLLTPEGFALHTNCVRPVTLMSEGKGEMDPELPLRFTYKPKPTGKYASEETLEEELLELQPMTEAIQKIFTPALTVFTTRPDTLFGATYLVLAPEHPFLTPALEKDIIQNKEEVREYIKASKAKSEEDRLAENKEKTGIQIKGFKAINPANGEEIPVWVADYVLGGYGTGAIMAVPAHDERDKDFAKAHNLPIREVVNEEGLLVHSAAFNGLTVDTAKERIVGWLREKGAAEGKVQYRLRDWLISRQRYWGPPIPMIFCDTCAKSGNGERADMPGWYTVPDKDLPVKLPMVKDFRPHGTGESPLASVKSFYETKCPGCKSKARRETDVSDTFLDSAWYYLRYPNVKEKKQAWNPDTIARFFPVDMYIGGAEHSVLHLLYVRFLSLALHDMGLLSFPDRGTAPEGEPFPTFRAHGLIIKEGAKMSKSKGNVVNPDEYIKKYGADTLRMYLMFLAPFEQGGDFRDQAVPGISRFLERFLKLVSSEKESTNMAEENKIVHQTIKKVGNDLATLHYNTAISALMICLNGLEELGGISKTNKEILVKLLAPLAPHLSEDLWRTNLKHKTSVHLEDWPQYDHSLAVETVVTLIVQINGKTRASLEVAANISEEEAKDIAMKEPKVQAAMAGGEPKKIFYVPGRLINIVV